eukprot:scaffold42545_cov24-Phaeocystis_antarctica.AAC.1
MGWGSEARGRRQRQAAAAGGSGRRQAAGGRRQAAGGRRQAAGGRRQAAPDEASTGRCRSGPGRTSRASRRRSVPQYALGTGVGARQSVTCRAGRSARRRRRRRRAAEGEDEYGKHAVHARCIAPERRCLEQVVAVEKSQIPIFKKCRA